MVTKITKSQLVGLKDLFDSYKRYSENPNYNVEEVIVMAHPHISDRIYVKTTMNGVSSGRPFDETKFVCILADGQQTECIESNNITERREFQDALVPVTVTPTGEIQKK